MKADLTREEFERQWRGVPLWLRLAAWIAAPLIGLRLRWFGSRDQLARRAEVEDSLSSEEILSWDPSIAALRHSIVHARDERLIELLGQEIDCAVPGQRLAVVFGAAHMRAVIRELDGRGFRAADAAWQTVFYL